MKALKDTILQSAQFRKLHHSYATLPARDQVAVKVLLAALCAALVYFLIWMPGWKFYQGALRDSASAEHILAYVKANETLARQASKSLGGAKRKDQNKGSIISSVTASGKSAGIEIKRYEPLNNNKLRLWIESAPFDKLVTWLESLGKTYDIAVEEIAIDQGEKVGTVNGRLTLTY